MKMDIESYLESVVPPEPEGVDHDQMKERLLDEMKNRRAAADRRRCLTLHALIVALGVSWIGGVGLLLRNHSFIGEKRVDCQADVRQGPGSPHTRDTASEPGAIPVVVSKHNGKSEGNRLPEAGDMLRYAQVLRPDRRASRVPEVRNSSRGADQTSTDMEVQIHQLMRRIHELEERVALLEKHRAMAVIPAPQLPGQVPKDWEPRIFNGIQYYVIPLGDNPNADNHPCK